MVESIVFNINLLPKNSNGVSKIISKHFSVTKQRFLDVRNYLTIKKQFKANK